MAWPCAALALSWATLLCSLGCCIARPPLRRPGLPDPSAAAPIPQPTARKTFTQKVNHFNDWDTRTFEQRYFVWDKVYLPGGPMFFYTGNEGPLEAWYNNTGLPFDWAAEFGALVVFGEHRYYGQTLPFGASSFVKENLGYLSIEQVLADYALLVSHLKQERGAKHVVTFGGSYGGMLSAWARIKYPNVFDMALAASAPIPQAMNLVADKSTFYRIVTADAQKADAKCPNAVRAGFAAVIANAGSAEGLKKITDAFQLCNPLTADELDYFLQYARNAWTEMAMCDYPYASSFLAPLPAWPIAAACEKVVSAKSPMEGLAAATAMPYRDPNATCFDMHKLFLECADQTGCGTGNDGKAWDYQMCTEIFYEQATTNVSDMFPPRNWTLAKLNAYCSATYGVTPHTAFDRIHFGGEDMAKVASKIVFSNGLLDPWHGGGYLTDQGPLLPAVVIDKGAHHLDLRPAHAGDPEGVIKARLKEKGYIKSWLEEGASLCGVAPSTTPPPDLGGGDAGVAAWVVVLLVICSMVLAAVVSSLVTLKMAPRQEAREAAWPMAVQLNQS